VFLILILNILKELIIPSLIFLLVNFYSATMASKKDREKGKIVNPPISKSLVTKPESSPIGTLAATPITTSLALTNRFMTFSPEPNIIFSSPSLLILIHFLVLSKNQDCHLLKLKNHQLIFALFSTPVLR
jgi:hypothetical protein